MLEQKKITLPFITMFFLANNIYAKEIQTLDTVIVSA